MSNLPLASSPRLDLLSLLARVVVLLPSVKLKLSSVKISWIYYSDKMTVAETLLELVERCDSFKLFLLPFS